MQMAGASQVCGGANLSYTVRSCLKTTREMGIDSTCVRLLLLDRKPRMWCGTFQKPSEASTGHLAAESEREWLLERPP